MKNISSLGRVVTTLLATGALLAGAVGVGVVAPASATTAGLGVYIATGHDLDDHCDPGTIGEPLSCDELKVLINHATTAATPNVLAITSDPNSSLTNALAQLTGITYDSIDALNDPSGFATKSFAGYDVVITESIWGNGSDSSAPDTFVTTLNTRKADLIAYYNAGGGVIQQANGGSNSGSDVWASQYYLALGFYAASVDQNAPHSVTTLGTTWGITQEMTDCCQTHNAFLHPPTTMADLELDANGLPITVVYTEPEMPAEGIGGNTLTIDMTLTLTPGQPVLGAPVVVSGSWLKAASEWSLVLDGTPQTSCDTGDASIPTNIYGALLCGFGLPDLAEGTHTLVLTGIAPDGTVLTRTATIVVDGSGNLVSFSYTDPGYTAAAAAEPSLALTGVNANEILTISLLAAMLLIAGGAIFALRRRSNA